MKTIEELETLKPCSEALIWVKQQSSLQEAWNKCERSDWMWWFLRKTNKVDKELCIKYSKLCASHVAHLCNKSAAAAAYAAYAATAYTAYAAADAADAAAAAYAAAAAAADAAECAAVYAAAADYAGAAATAAAAERKWQAEQIRTLIPNPFL